MNISGCSYPWDLLVIFTILVRLLWAMDFFSRTFDGAQRISPYPEATNHRKSCPQITHQTSLRWTRNSAEKKSETKNDHCANAVPPCSVCGVLANLINCMRPVVWSMITVLIGLLMRKFLCYQLDWSWDGVVRSWNTKSQAFTPHLNFNLFHLLY